MSKLKILFVCTGNTCRSPMAEALFNAIAAREGVDATATSAGTNAHEGMSASIGAVSAMQEVGIDISDHMSKGVNEFLVSEADLVLCMQKSHANLLVVNFPEYSAKIHTLKGYAFGADSSIADPFGGDSEVYAKCAAEIAEAVSAVVQGISRGADGD